MQPVIKWPTGTGLRPRGWGLLLYITNNFGFERFGCLGIDVTTLVTSEAFSIEHFAWTPLKMTTSERRTKCIGGICLLFLYFMSYRQLLNWAFYLEFGFLLSCVHLFWLYCGFATKQMFQTNVHPFQKKTSRNVLKSTRRKFWPCEKVWGDWFCELCLFEW